MPESRIEGSHYWPDSFTHLKVMQNAVHIYTATLCQRGTPLYLCEPQGKATIVKASRIIWRASMVLTAPIFQQIYKQKKPHDKQIFQTCVHIVLE